jgi:hypothetical protein
MQTHVLQTYTCTHARRHTHRTHKYTYTFVLVHVMPAQSMIDITQNVEITLRVTCINHLTCLAIERCQVDNGNNLNLHTEDTVDQCTHADMHGLGQNCIPGIYTVYDRIFGDFPANNTVHTPYTYGSGQPLICCPSVTRLSIPTFA